MTPPPLLSTSRAPIHPRQVLLGAQAGKRSLPVCDHYAGTLPLMEKSIALQAQMQAEFGTNVFDLTLDCEDGAPVGQEIEHAARITELVLKTPPQARLAVRVHAIDHPCFESEVAHIVGAMAERLTHIMVPKIETLSDVQQAVLAVSEAARGQGISPPPLHALIESPLALQHVHSIAAHPQIQSLAFGLMDFVSAHGGAIPDSAMSAEGQFQHPLVQRAKLEIASACHAYGKVPAHCVVTEFKDTARLSAAARKAIQEYGYTRMWSIHPAQIRPIVEAFRPLSEDIDHAATIIDRAMAADWGPIAHDGVLHDRASYRYYWQVLERAYNTGAALPQPIKGFFEDT